MKSFSVDNFVKLPVQTVSYMDLSGAKTKPTGAKTVLFLHRRQEAHRVFSLAKGRDMRH